MRSPFGKIAVFGGIGEGGGKSINMWTNGRCGGVRCAARFDVDFVAASCQFNVQCWSQKNT